MMAESSIKRPQLRPRGIETRVPKGSQICRKSIEILSTHPLGLHGLHILDPSEIRKSELGILLSGPRGAVGGGGELLVNFWWAFGGLLVGQLV